jgi:Ankyrin repeats (many copies)
VTLDLDQARRQAKELLRAARSGEAEALGRLRGDRSPRLADAQAAVAQSLGFRSWPALVADGLTAYSRADREQFPRWASAGDDQVVARLLDAGVPIDARGRGQGTALHHAGLWGRASTVRLLLARGADIGLLAEPPDQPGAQDWTAIDWTTWGSRQAPTASDRQGAYRDCAAVLLAAGARISERAPIAQLIDEVRDSGLTYRPGRPVRIRVRVRGTQVDVDDMGGAVAVAGMPAGWHEVAERVVAELNWNVRRNGVVCMQAPRGRRLAWIIDCTAEASAAMCDAILEIGA